MQEIILSTDNPLMQVPNSFFDETKLLKLLELIGFDCSKLPSSFGLIRNLQALSMYNCKLGDITMVGELTNLQILVLLGTRIQQLPRQIEQLQKLLILDLRDTYIQMILSNVLSNLTSLEELYLRNSFCNWEVERSNSENRNASLKELTNLHHLAYIEDLYVPDPQAWPMDLYFEKIKSYTIFIGDRWVETHNGDHGLKVLKLKLDRKLQLEDGIKRMVKNVDVLYLDELYGVQNILSDLGSDGFLHLQSLPIQNNVEIKCIAMSSSDDHPIDAFPNLESLSLKNVSNLKHICHGSLSEKSFFKIRVIRVQQCHEMTCLFSDSMVKSLPYLVDLEVSECKLIEAIVVGGEEIIVFPHLRSLKLQGLPALLNFYMFSSYVKHVLFDDKLPELLWVCCLSEDAGDALRVIGFPEMAKMHLEDLPSLMRFFSKGYVELPSLENVVLNHCPQLDDFGLGTIESSQLKSMIIDNQDQIQNDALISQELVLMELPDVVDIWEIRNLYNRIPQLNNLRKIHIKSCPSMMVVIHPEVRKLPQLNELKIQECKNLTKVLPLFYLDPIKFLALSKVELMYLPKLVMFHENHGLIKIELPVLKTLVIEKCPELEIFTHGLATAYDLPTDDRNSFFKLNELKLDTCHMLVYVISSKDVTRVSRIDKTHCKSL
ncbi:probable disease resistance protein At4g27220 [Abrus precatorius]|uniref:Probable disease resistance protein At4g27220 n=1 Tax=Abrus precatorius TaxID=3816 RepID=A0A8B8KD03_ABRPR|nr:probable disease resistance protein At4g27220 [Abrus precatorius]